MWLHNGCFDTSKTQPSFVRRAFGSSWFVVNQWSLSQSKESWIDDGDGGAEGRPEKSFAEPREQAIGLLEDQLASSLHHQESRRSRAPFRFSKSSCIWQLFPGT